MLEAVVAAVCLPEPLETAVRAVGAMVATARLVLPVLLIPEAVAAVAALKQAELAMAAQAVPASSSSSTPYPYSLS
jgi:hypothetical protein